MSRDEAFKILDAIKPDKNGCINFTGVKGTSPVGYRYILFVDGQQIAASRLALERKLKRPIAPGFQARHTCGNQSCVAKSHLVETMHGRSAA